jgi:tetratricopeptide (TPR) repeat protein
MRRLFKNVVRRRCGNVGCDRYGREVPALAEVCADCLQPPVRAIRLEPIEIVLVAAAALLLLGSGWYAIGRWQAHRTLERLAAAATARRAQAHGSLTRGRSLVGQHRYEEARVAFEEAAHGDPENAIAWVDLGAIDMLVGHADAALDCYDKALTLDPNNWLAHYNLGVHAARGGDRDAAFGHFRRALAGLPAVGRERREVIHDLLAEPALAAVRADPRFADLLGTVSGAAPDSAERTR